MKRDLDGIYIRVQRDDKWESVCLTDLTEEEFEAFAEEVDSKENAIDWWRNIAKHLREQLIVIGEVANIVYKDEEEKENDQ